MAAAALSDRHQKERASVPSAQLPGGRDRGRWRVETGDRVHDTTSCVGCETTSQGKQEYLACLFKIFDVVLEIATAQVASQLICLPFYLAVCFVWDGFQ